MKKNTIFIFIFIITVLFNSNVYADDIKVYIDSVEIRFDIPPIIENGRTLVPMRAIFESLGAEVDWDNDTKTAAAYKGDIGEAFDNVVNWNNDSRSVTISSNSVDVPIDSNTNSASGIVGYWSTTHFSNLRVDAYSGFPLDDYSGEWYAFWDDGTYVRLMTGAGTVINGTASYSGKYTVDSDSGTITFFEIKESWVPSKSTESKKAYTNKTIEDYTVTLQINDDNQTIRIGSTLWSSTTEFTRVVE